MTSTSCEAPSRIMRKRSVSCTTESCTFRSATCLGKGEHLPYLVPPPAVRNSFTKPSAVSLCDFWKVDDEYLPSLPPLYFLEKTCRTIDRTQSSPSEIATRISAALKLMNIAATYDDEKATAHLFTADHVELNVSLFKDENGGTIVEVQRWTGSALSYQYHARLILSAATGVIEARQTTAKKIPAVPHFGTGRETAILEQKAHTMCALNLAGALINHNRLDAKILGLESLGKLTQASETSGFTARMAAQVVLTGTICANKETLQNDAILFRDDGVEIPALGIQKGILDLMLRKTNRPEDTTDAGCDFLLTNKIYSLALFVLANSLAVFSDEVSYMTARWSRFAELVPTLIGLMRNAGHNPHDANLSAKCLSILLQSSMDARESVRGFEAVSVASAEILGL